MMKNSINVENRIIGLDLFRIACMLGITAIHLLGHGGAYVNIQSGLLYRFVQFAVSGFVIMSGYLLCKRRLDCKRVIKVIIPVLFYSIVFYLLYLYLNSGSFNFWEAKLNFFPILSRRYWFVSNYISLLLFMPILNKVIQALDKREYKVFIFLLIVIFYLSSDLKNIIAFAGIGYNIESLGAFIILYFIGAYIRKIELTLKDTGVFYLGLSAIIFLLINFAEQILLPKFTSATGIVLEINTLYLFYSITLFLFFLKLKFKSGKITNLIRGLANVSFSVYLIHDNAYFRTYLWNMINITQYAGYRYYIFILMFVVLLVYFGCSFIEACRQLLFRYTIQFSKYIKNKVNYS